MTGLLNMPAGTDEVAEPDGEPGGADPSEPAGPDGPGTPADAELVGDPGAFVTAAPEQAWTTTVSTARVVKRESARRTVNP
jgi:hypothetical protein